MTHGTEKQRRSGRRMIAGCIVALLICGGLSGAVDPAFGGDAARSREEAAEAQGIASGERPATPRATRLPLELFENPAEKLPPPVADTGGKAERPGADAATATGTQGAEAERSASASRFVARPEVRGKPGPAEWTVELRPPDAKPGDEVTLAITARLDPGWHTYSITQPPGNAATATALEVRRLTGLEPLDSEFRTLDAFEVYRPPGLEGITQQIHHGTVRWVRRFRVVGVPYGVAGTIAFQVCNDLQYLRGVHPTHHAELNHLQTAFWQQMLDEMKKNPPGNVDPDTIDLVFVYRNVDLDRVIDFAQSTEADSEHSEKWITAGIDWFGWKSRTVRRTNDFFKNDLAKRIKGKADRYQRVGITLNRIGVFMLFYESASAAASIANHSNEQRARWESLEINYRAGLEELQKKGRLSAHRAHQIRQAWKNYSLSINLPEDTVDAVDIFVAAYIDANLEP